MLAHSQPIKILVLYSVGKGVYMSEFRKRCCCLATLRGFKAKGKKDTSSGNKKLGNYTVTPSTISKHSLMKYRHDLAGKYIHNANLGTLFPSNAITAANKIERKTGQEP
jgi:hypothetical protein